MGSKNTSHIVYHTYGARKPPELRRRVGTPAKKTRSKSQISRTTCMWSHVLLYTYTIDVHRDGISSRVAAWTRRQYQGIACVNFLLLYHFCCGHAVEVRLIQIIRGLGDQGLKTILLKRKTLQYVGQGRGNRGSHERVAYREVSIAPHFGKVCLQYNVRSAHFPARQFQFVPHMLLRVRINE